MADLRSGEQRMIGYGLFPLWSPSKAVDRIAFQKHRQRGTRWFSLWTLDLIEGEGRRLTEIASSPNAAVVAPSWSPDGHRLAFATIVEPARLGTDKDGRWRPRPSSTTSRTSGRSTPTAATASG